MLCMFLGSSALDGRMDCSKQNTDTLGIPFYLKQFNPANQGRSIVESKLNHIGQHDLQVFDACFELVVVIVPSVTVHIQNTVVQGLQAFDELLKRALQAAPFTAQASCAAVSSMLASNIQYCSITGLLYMPCTFFPEMKASYCCTLTLQYMPSV